MKTSKFSTCAACPLVNQILVHGETNVPQDLSLVRLLILAEAPATKEVELGLPLKGRAGIAFRKPFELSGLCEIPYFINNVVMCANLYTDPETNKLKTDNPPKEAIECCKPNWEAIIKIVQPEYILIMGGIAQKLFGIDDKISDARGRAYPYNGDTSGLNKVPKVFLTFHPSFIARGTAPKHKIEQFNNDFNVLYELMMGDNEVKKTKKIQSTKLRITEPYVYSIPNWTKTEDVCLIDIQKHPKSKDVYYIFRDKYGKRKYHIDKTGDYYYYKIDGRLGDSPVLMPVSETEFILEKPKYNREEARYEADNKVTFKHSIDYYIQRKIPEINLPLVKFFMDIEAYNNDSLEFPSPHTAPKPINAISFKINEEPINVYIVDPNKLAKIELNIDKELKDLDTTNVKIFKSEKDLLINFCKVIKEIEPDLILTWNGTRFDIPYIYNRLKRNMIDPSDMSPLGYMFVDVNKFEEIDILGTHHLDMLEMYKNLTPNKKESYALGAIANDELGEGKVEYEGSLDFIYKNDLKKFIRYSAQDTNILYELDKEKGHADLTNELRKVCSSTWHGTKSTVGLLDPLCVSYAKKKGMVMKNSEMHKSDEKLPGAYVKIPEAGVYKWLVDFDYRSLYPSVIMSLNIGPDTIIGKIDPMIAEKYIYKRELPEIVEVNITPMHLHDIRYKNMTKSEFDDWMNLHEATISIVGTIFMGHNKKISFMSEICSTLLDARVEYKDKMKISKRDKDPIWKLYYNKQWSYKILANALYGVLGTFSFRLFKLDLAKTITGTAQEALKFAMHHTSSFMKTDKSEIDTNFLNENFDRDIPYIIYGDTDSIFVDMSEYLMDKNIMI